jgi:hypothetical protein
LWRLGITHQQTAYHCPEENSELERFHPSLKEEEVWAQSIGAWKKARPSIAI